MLNLAERYWQWRNRKPKPKSKYKTDSGYTVKRFDSLWAVAAGGGEYKDLKGSWRWSPGDRWFKDCLATKQEIEAAFGKILGLEEENTEINP